MSIAKIKDEIEIAYLYEKRDDKKEPVVFLNGSIFNYKQWIPAYLPAFQSLTNNSRSYVLYDYQGIGKSSPKIDPYTLQALANELLGLLNALKLERVHLFGVSKGTMVSQVFTGLYPDRVLTIGGYGIANLLDPKIEYVRDLFVARLASVMTLKDLFSERITSTNFKQLVRTVYTPAIFNKPYSQLTFREKFIHWIIERKVYPMLEGTPIRSLELLFRYYAEELGNEIDYFQKCVNAIGEKPVLLLNGTGDQITPVELARDLKNRLKNASLIEFDNYEHIRPSLNKKEARSIMKEYTNFLYQHTHQNKVS
ncbi:MAG: alpha/beta hydrolase [Candidatus Heimdallarchaeota archaeon]|nr:MAG: alpha/beta hydrolase [Candidatus Heimdallarchaeota archaeon]